MADSIHFGVIAFQQRAGQAVMSRHVFNEKNGCPEFQAVCRVLGVMCQHLFQFPSVAAAVVQHGFQPVVPLETTAEREAGGNDRNKILFHNRCRFTNI